MMDIYGVQEPNISLFRWVVLQFDRGTPNPKFQDFGLESNEQAYITVRTNSLWRPVSLI